MEHLAVVFSELILSDQNCFASEDGSEALLQLIPDTRVVECLRSSWSGDPFRSSGDKWNDLKSQIKKYEKGTSQRVGCFVQHPRPLVLSMVPGSSNMRIRGHNITIHLSASGCGSFQASKPSSESAVLCPPQDRAGMCAH